MVSVIGDNIISSLGFTTLENFKAVKRGVSGLQTHQLWDLPEPFTASLIDRERLRDAFADIEPHSNAYTPFEQAMIVSVHQANKRTNIDLASPRVLFIVSTTKGNVDLINNEQLIMNNVKKEENHYSLFTAHCSLYLWHSAALVSQFFGNPNTPLVVSNACISGGCAQIAAQRALQSDKYDYAVVVGADLLCKFIVSGFQSFKALSAERCKPFDKTHCGLNLGEAAATMIFCNEQLIMNNEQFVFQLIAGAICNDATHISAPSKTGEGSFKALTSILQNIPNLTSQIAFINAHGTATPYNDDMEAVAIARAGLAAVPINSLKGCFGHTLGAAGILESIISAKALEEEIALASQGYEEQNTENQINITTENIDREQPYFIKMMSGFGGTNAVLLFKKPSSPLNDNKEKIQLNTTLYITNHCKITGSLTDLYRDLKIDYPKFFKMDNLCKAGFLAAEILLQNHKNKSETAIICFTSAASLNTDKAFEKTIQDKDAFFPSPALFVYTLPNIANGEIAIRHGCHAETSCYVSEKENAEMIAEIVNQTFNNTPDLQQALVGWLNDDNHCQASMMLVEREGEKIFTEENIKTIIHN
jgi:3-oxoacyl-[acyl-carrier-protein] synthase-1